MKLISIDEYRTLKYDYIKVRVIICRIIIIFLAIILLILYFFKFDITYKNKYLVVEYSNALLLSTNVLDNDLNKITENKYMYINNKRYKYDVVGMEDMVNKDVMLNYKVVYLRVDTKLILNNIIDSSIIYDRKNCFKIIFDYIFMGE